MARRIDSYVAGVSGRCGFRIALIVGALIALAPPAAAAIAQQPAPITDPAEAQRVSAEIQRLITEGRAQEGLELLERTIPRLEVTFGREDQPVLMAIELSGDLHYGLGRPAEAARQFARILPVVERVSGADHPDTIKLLAKLGAAYGAQQSKWAEAEPLFRRALEAARRTHGPDHGATLSLTQSLANLYFAAGHFADAQPLAAQGREIAERTLGPEHQATLSFAGLLALIQSNLSRFAEAESLSKEVLAVRERTLGPAHAETLTALNNLATVYQRQSRYEEAEPLFRRTVEGRTALFGAEHPETLTALNNLAVNLTSRGRLTEAEPILLRELSTRERVLPPDDPSLAITRNNLASLLLELGKLEQVDALFRRSVAGLEGTLGADHPNTLQAKLNLVDALTRAGRLAEAEAIALPALERISQAQGPEHPTTLYALSVVAQLFGSQQRLPQAEALYRRLLAARRKIAGDADRETLRTASDLAAVLHRQGRIDEAEALYQDTAAKAQGAFGPNDPLSLQVATGLANLRIDQRRFAEAEQLHRRVLDADQAALGRAHPRVLISMHNLGSLYVHQERHAEAASLWREAYGGQSRLYGRESPNAYFAAHVLTATLLNLDGREQEALKVAREMVEGVRARRLSASDRLAQRQNAREAIGAASGFRMFADAAWANIAARPADRNAVLPEAFRALQESSAGEANAAIAQMAVRRAADAQAGLGALVREREELGALWAALTERHAQTFAAEGGGAAEQRAALDLERRRTSERIDGIDQRLRRDFPDYFRLIRPDPVTIEAAQALVGADEAILLAIPALFGTHVIAVTREGISWVRSAMTGNQVHDAVERLRFDLRAQPNVTPEQLRRWEEERAAQPGLRFSRSIAHQLHEAVIAPVAERLRGKRRLFVVASGPLAGIPFSVLVAEPPPGEDDDPASLRATRWLADQFELAHLPTIQSLAALRRTGATSVRGGFAGFGNPALDGAPQRRGDRSASELPTAQSVTAATRTAAGGMLANPAALRALARLPGTVEELQAMRELFGSNSSRLFTGLGATETAVKQADLTQARVITFATHGLSPQDSTRRGERVITAGRLFNLAEPGLVLTPPNTATEQDDGYLAASEVATLRIAADWVILSACNSASGDAATSGLSQLARAFFYAGARSLLASHWPVSDAVAVRLTAETVRLEQGGGGTPPRTRADSLREAMRQVRSDVSQDTGGQSLAHPFFWAPFVLMGDGAATSATGAGAAGD